MPIIIQFTCNQILFQKNNINEFYLILIFRVPREPNQHIVVLRIIIYCQLTVLRIKPKYTLALTVEFQYMFRSYFRFSTILTASICYGRFNIYLSNSGILTNFQHSGFLLYLLNWTKPSKLIVWHTFPDILFCTLILSIQTAQTLMRLCFCLFFTVGQVPVL